MASSTEKPAGWSVLLRAENAPALAALLGGVLLHSMNVLLLATVLPSIVGELGGAALMSWPTTAFLASSIVAATCTGLLTARIGARNTFCAGALVFSLGALLCGFAPSMAQIVAGRFVQGFGGGLLTAVAYVLVRTTFPEAAWPRAISLMAAMWSVSILVGPTAGGLFAKLGDWRSAFFCVVVLALGLVALAWRALPPTPRAEKIEAPPSPSARVALICLAIAAMSSAAVATAPILKAVLIAASVAILVLELRLDRQAKVPLLPRDAFATGTQTGLGLWLVLMLAIAFSPLQIYLPVFLQRLHGLDPLAAGYIMACTSFGWTVGALAMAGLTPVAVDRLLLAGPACMAAGLLAVALLTAETVGLALPLAVFLTGVGIGGCWGHVAQRVMGGARKGEESIAASSVATVQQIGFALGAALAGLAANSAGLASGLAREGVVAASFWTPVVFVVAAVLAGVAAVRLNLFVCGQREVATPLV